VKHARVGIVMGSESDRPVMEEAARVLEEFGVASEVEVRSAHRTPDAAREWAHGARARGIEVIIAGAGGAAHLAGAMAAHSRLPVLGVPLASSPLLGDRKSSAAAILGAHGISEFRWSRGAPDRRRHWRRR